MDITVIGLGKLGLPLACLHAKSHRVHGIDANPSTVSKIARGISPIVEPGIDSLLKEVIDSGNLTVSASYVRAEPSDMTLIIVPSPSDETGAFDSSYVVEAVRQQGMWVDPGHVVVVCSTVMPGACEGEIRTALEESSHLRVGEEIGLVYSPEFIALGSVIRDMENPAMTLIGESDARSGSLYEAICPPGRPVRHMSLMSAEIAKISLNAYVTMKISFANTLGELCESYPNADAGDITEAVGLDPRVGSKYIRPGGPYGGPCFPRDNRAFALVGENVGVPMPLAKATDAINDRQIDRVVRHVASYSQRTVGILGLSYKPGAPITEESFGVKLADALRRTHKVRVWDRLVERDDHLFGEGVEWSGDVASCVGNDIITIIALPDPVIISNFPRVFSGDSRTRSTVVDCWDCLPEGPWDETNVVRLNRYLHAAQT